MDLYSKEQIPLQALYAKGVTDPHYFVLRFTAQSGRYYSNFKSEDFSVE
jgi:general stress protein 26